MSCVITVRPRSPFGRNESSDSALIANAEPTSMLPIDEAESRRNGVPVTRAANVVSPPSIFFDRALSPSCSNTPAAYSSPCLKKLPCTMPPMSRPGAR